MTQSEDGTLSWSYGEAPKLKPQYKTLRAIYFGPEGDNSVPFKQQGDLVEYVGVQKGAISKHLKALKRAGLITTSRDCIHVTAAGIKCLEQHFPDDEFGA